MTGRQAVKISEPWELSKIRSPSPGACFPRRRTRASMTPIYRSREHVFPEVALVWTVERFTSDAVTTRRAPAVSCTYSGGHCTRWTSRCRKVAVTHHAIRKIDSRLRFSLDNSCATISEQPTSRSAPMLLVRYDFHEKQQGKYWLVLQILQFLHGLHWPWYGQIWRCQY